MDEQHIINTVWEYVQENQVDDLHHGLGHIKRVRGYAKAIARTERANWFLVDISAMLHDIGRGKETKGEYHTQTGAKIGRELLESLDMPKELILIIVEGIQEHSRKAQYQGNPTSLEAKCVYDADGLDLVGAVGAIRAGFSCWAHDGDWEYVLEGIKWRTQLISDFRTNTGKKLAESRRKLLDSIYQGLVTELRSY